MKPNKKETNNHFPNSDGLHITSWNIHDIQTRDEGIKTNLYDYKKVTRDAAIVCLQETKRQVKIPGFRCYNSNRTNSRSGGICIAVRNALSPLVSPLPVEHPDILAINLKSTVLGYPTVLITAYDSPESSSFKKLKKNSNQDSITECILDLISRCDQDTEVIVCGDFNARLGNNLPNEHHNTIMPDLPGLPVESEIDPGSALLQNLPPRSSEDRKTNTKAKAFLHMVQSANLTILNGRTIGDIYGAPTCIRPNGVSTVDYFCSSSYLLDRVNSLKVGPISTISDHRPLHLKFRATPKTSPCASSSGPFTNSSKAAPKGFKWVSKDHQSGTAFLAALSRPTRVQQIESLLNTQINTKDESTELNNKLTRLLTDAGSEALKSSNATKRKGKASWYDDECWDLKIKSDKTASNLTKKPDDPAALHSYHEAKRIYRKTIRSKKASFLTGLNRKIEGDKSINWVALRKLKTETSSQDGFDLLDLHNFFCFFRDLYSNRCPNNLEDHPDPSEPGKRATNADLSILNDSISQDELETCIKGLKPNKSASLDLIRNEMIKNLPSNMTNLILKHFNGCLTTGNYPWNESVTTVIHKKGDKENPDNYRAITLGSCLGKLYSTILLNRLIDFRKKVCPDTINQLGFCKGGQTSDHLLVLKTILDKYLKKKKVKVFSCFIDMRKAFDRVCRQALLKKLADMDVVGNFFNCLKTMYESSSTCIKLSERISETFLVQIGTEQGHPLSPELFKMFIHDLSIQLNLVPGSYPTLTDKPITHLMWADDIVILALDGPTLQGLLDTLGEYTKSWELEVNLDKTQVMIFNAQGRLLQVSQTFTFLSEKLKGTRQYCYLGLIFSLSGSLKAAFDNLATKGKKACIALRRSINSQHLTGWSLIKLFDHLISPILTYGCPIWIPNTEAAKTRSRPNTDDPKSYFKRITSDSFERVHLWYLKWVLGVHSRTTNTAVYGETGRAPLSIATHHQGTNYFIRALNKALDDEDSSLLALAAREQRHLKLDWFIFWETAYNLGGRIALDQIHVDHWETLRQSQSKLSFFNQAKDRYGYSDYLNLPKGVRTHIAKIRMSAHDLKIETGRYTGDNIRACRFCVASQVTELLYELPMSDPLVESEHHAIFHCPAYEELRSRSPPLLRNALLTNNITELFAPQTITQLNTYLDACRALRMAAAHAT